jgi:hypothetical protein
MKTLRGWWLFNDLEVTRRVRLSRYVGLYDNERVPTRQELHAIFEHGDPQKRVCCVLNAFSGVRPGVIGNMYGAGGHRSVHFDWVQIRAKRIQDTGRDAVRLVDPDPVPCILNKFKVTCRHPSSGGSALIDRREDVFLSPNESRWNLEFSPSLIEQERRENTFCVHNAIKVPSQRAVVSEEIEPRTVEVFFRHSLGVSDEP